MRHVVAGNIFNARAISGANKFRGLLAFSRKNEKKYRLYLSTLCEAGRGIRATGSACIAGCYLGAPP
jgi:hypothetical protein